MKDLDFDELDQAVNSLIAKSPNLPVDNEVKPPVVDSNTVAPTPIGPVTSQSTSPILPPLAGRRSNGKFMDVVPPSSNTRVTPSIPDNVSRQGATINPISNLSLEPIKVPIPASTNEQPGSSLNKEWPDPIDFQGKNNITTTNKEPEKDDNMEDDIDKISNDITNTLGDKQAESPESPFVSGAKVDKRPLGAFSNDTPKPMDGALTQSDKSNEPDVVKPSSNTFAPVSSNAPLPAELHNDLIKVESGGDTVDTTKLAVTETSATTLTNTNAPSTTTSPVDNQPTGPTSITQQYKEQPSSGDQSTGAIYDTNSYHKGILVNKKKKSGWMWVLWTVILLVVGSAVGAAVYYFVLPNL